MGITYGRLPEILGVAPVYYLKSGNLHVICVIIYWIHYIPEIQVRLMCSGE